MKVFDFFEFCPPDHDITIRFHSSNREVFLRTKYDIWDKTKGVTYRELYEEIESINADTVKAFYITTKS